MTSFVPGEVHACSQMRHNRHVRQRCDVFRQPRHKMPVLDVPAERVEADFRCGKSQFGCTPQPAGIVDNTHDFESRRLRVKIRPNAQRLGEP